MTWQIEVDIFEIVGASTANFNEVHALSI
jgi:hypothetical protein